MIGNDGHVYEGRGFNFHGEHTQNHYGSTFNDIGICVAFVGNFGTSELNPKMIETFETFVEYAFINKVLSIDYKVLFQGQLIEMVPPVIVLFDQIKTISNFHSSK